MISIGLRTLASISTLGLLLLIPSAIGGGCYNVTGMPDADVLLPGWSVTYCNPNSSVSSWRYTSESVGTVVMEVYVDLGAGLELYCRNQTSVIFPGVSCDAPPAEDHRIVLSSPSGAAYAFFGCPAGQLPC